MTVGDNKKRFLILFKTKTIVITAKTVVEMRILKYF